jgi:hypothetical protein
MSLEALQESEFLEMVWGLASSYQPFLWVVRRIYPRLKLACNIAKWFLGDGWWKEAYYQMRFPTRGASTPYHRRFLDAQWLEFQVGEYM